MSDQPKSLSEISHLFLSGVRAKTQGPNRPMRIPPQPRTDMTIDLTPEEFAQVFGEETGADQAGPTVGPISAILGSHLGAHQLDRVRQYASSLCAGGARVGLIAVDASEFRLSIFQRESQPQEAAVDESEMLDARKMGQALEELAWDVDRWLLLLPSPRAPEARSLLREVQQWTLLSATDHEGVVSCYRTLKGLSDLNRPKLSLATIDAGADSVGAYQRLSSVCRQFLDWSLDDEGPIIPASDVTEHVVLWCNGTRDKAQLASAPQWQVVNEFLAKAKRSPRVTEKPAASAPVAVPVAPPEPQIKQPVAGPVFAPVHETPPDAAEVIDLPNAASDPSAICGAVIRGGHELVEAPVKPPMCPEASLAVSREHRLVLVAVARQGLIDLQQIGKAYQWLIENRSLIALAVPQMSIDAHQLPQLQLLVDHADTSAQLLIPIMHAPNVSVRSYRKLHWAGKTGLLVEAA